MVVQQLILLLLLLLLLLACVAAARASEAIKVAFIVPTTSRSLSELTALENTYLFTNLFPSLRETLTAEELNAFEITVFLGVDAGDAVFDKSGASRKMKKMFEAMFPSKSLSLRLVRLEGMQGRIGHIWNGLVARAYRSAHEYFAVLSDDAVLKSAGWLTHIIDRLHSNNNFGTVALFEEHKQAAPGTWPTFPCFHRTHVDIFHGFFSPSQHGGTAPGTRAGSDADKAVVAFDPTFVNSYVDIWIADVYSIFPSSAGIEPRAVVANTVGGEGAPRYNPSFAGWDAYVDAVQRARRRVAVYLATAAAAEAEARVKGSGGDDAPRGLPTWCYLSGSAQQSASVAVDGAAEPSHTPSFTWSPRALAYGPEGHHFADYCAQAPGCVDARTRLDAEQL